VFRSIPFHHRLLSDLLFARNARTSLPYNIRSILFSFPHNVVPSSYILINFKILFFRNFNFFLNNLFGWALVLQLLNLKKSGHFCSIIIFSSFNFGILPTCILLHVRSTDIKSSSVACIRIFVEGALWRTRWQLHHQVFFRSCGTILRMHALQKYFFPSHNQNESSEIRVVPYISVTSALPALIPRSGQQIGAVLVPSKASSPRMCAAPGS